MTSCIIFKKDLEKLGRKLMKDFYIHTHDKYMLTFPEVKLKRKYYDSFIIKKYLMHKLETEDKNEALKNLSDKLKIDLQDETLINLYSKVKLIYANESPEKETFKKLFIDLENEIENENLDLDLISHFICQMKYRVKLDEQLDMELDEDLWHMKKAFIQLYNVYDHNYSYLEHSKYFSNYKINQDMFSNIFGSMKDMFSNIFEIFD